MDKHTSGPWAFEETAAKSVHGSNCVGFVISDKTNVADVCASYNITDEEAIANGYVLAAASDLLKAARKALNFLLNTQASVGIQEDSEDEFDTTRALRAAIAKATSSTGSAS